jgi:hypothetical protein
MGKFGTTAADEAMMDQLEEQYCKDNGLEYVPRAGLRVGSYLGPRPRDLNQAGMFHGKSEWDALGLPVPFFRRSNGIKHLRDMGFTDRELMDRIVGRMSAHIERDDSHMALEDALKMGLDVTGCYRMLAVLLTGDPPTPPTSPPGPDASFVDLVTA